MARTRNRDQGNPANEPNSQAFGLLGRILDFLFDRIKILSPPLRAVAYFTFLAFFCFTAWRLMAGHYLVRGVVMEGKKLARGCEIRLNGDYFSTNSKGMYYTVLTPLQYYGYKVAGQVVLPVTCTQPDGLDMVVRGNFNVTLSRWNNQFSDINLAAQQASKAEPFSFGLIASAYADQAPAPAAAAQGTARSASPRTTPHFPSSGDRLVIERIELGDRARNMREVEFEIEIGDNEKPLLLEGAEAGDLPMRPNLVFGERYYFDVPRGWQGQNVEIEMEVPGLFGKEEEFPLNEPLQYNRPKPVRGSRGSTLVLRLVPRTPS